MGGRHTLAFRLVRIPSSAPSRTLPTSRNAKRARQSGELERHWNLPSPSDTWLGRGAPCALCIPEKVGNVRDGAERECDEPKRQGDAAHSKVAYTPVELEFSGRFSKGRQRVIAERASLRAA